MSSVQTEDLDLMSSQRNSTYTEAHRKSYIKRRESELIRMKNYYYSNKAAISARRKEKYYERKLLMIEICGGYYSKNEIDESYDSDDAPKCYCGSYECLVCKDN